MDALVLAVWAQPCKFEAKSARGAAHARDAGCTAATRGMQNIFDFGAWVARVAGCSKQPGEAAAMMADTTKRAAPHRAARVDAPDHHSIPSHAAIACVCMFFASPLSSGQSKRRINMCVLHAIFQHDIWLTCWPRRADRRGGPIGPSCRAGQ